MQKYNSRPEDCEGRPEIEIRCYDLLDSLGIRYDRADHPAAGTIADCHDIGEVIGAPICKNLFLCNRQGTAFYLLLMPGDKLFRTKDLSAALGVSRLSFADEAHMVELLGLTPGSVSVMGLMNDGAGRVRLVIDGDVLRQSRFGCHPCMNTSSLGMDTVDVLDILLPALEHTPTVVEL